jgi:hypothetical protein
MADPRSLIGRPVAIVEDAVDTDSADHRNSVQQRLRANSSIMNMKKLLGTFWPLIVLSLGSHWASPGSEARSPPCPRQKALRPVKRSAVNVSCLDTVWQPLLVSFLLFHGAQGLALALTELSNGAKRLTINPAVNSCQSR